MTNVIFNKDFYPTNAVKAAIKAYKDLADFQVKENEKCLEVKIKNAKPGIKDEFCNYVISAIKNETRFK
jgi:hypothetical protein